MLEEESIDSMTTVSPKLKPSEKQILITVLRKKVLWLCQVLETLFKPELNTLLLTADLLSAFNVHSKAPGGKGDTVFSDLFDPQDPLRVSGVGSYLQMDPRSPFIQ